MIIDKDKDPMGAAIADYHKNGVAGRLRVFSPQFEEDEIPVETLFREYVDMPEIEQYALNKAAGKILDVGAGAGCHALALQEMGKSVEAIDVSPLSVDTMQKRGVKNVRLIDFFDLNKSEEGERFPSHNEDELPLSHDESNLPLSNKEGNNLSYSGEGEAPSSTKYDTILFLMNGSGIIGKVENFASFFTQLDNLLSDDGVVYMDSSDIRYVFEDEDGSFEINLNDDYYGELEYQMQYKRVKGKPFSWLYVDFSTLQHYAESYGYDAEIVVNGEHYDYLACLRRRK